LALPSETETCRKCGGLLEKGIVAGDAGGRPATVQWVPDKRTPGTGGLYDAVDLAPLPFWAFSRSPTFPAMRCPRCQLIEIAYGPDTQESNVARYSDGKPVRPLPSDPTST
jgi:Domain of unknown function (DUF6487)